MLMCPALRPAPPRGAPVLSGVHAVDDRPCRRSPRGFHRREVIVLAFGRVLPGVGVRTAVAPGFSDADHLKSSMHLPNTSPREKNVT